jgi:hypothetical protein
VLSRDDFKTDDAPVAVCGVYCGGDGVHVGIVFKDEDEHQVLHFQSGDYIPLQSLDDHDFAGYLFNPVNFKPELIPSLAALAELVSQNALLPFTFSRNRPVYEGGKFEISTGNFQFNSVAERIVNCGVFVVALLKTYDYELIAWDTWPHVQVNAVTRYLEDWLNRYKVPVAERENYYKSAKEIRGKHILVSPDAPTQPAPYAEVVPLSNQLITNLQAATASPPAS